MKLKKPKQEHSSCDLSSVRKGPHGAPEKNRVYRHKGTCAWTGVRTEKYKPLHGGWSSVIRRVIVGNKQEKTRFHVRYFEIEPGGFTTFEMHRHEHVVIVLRGRGRVRIGKKVSEVRYLDTVFIKPYAPHQLRNPFSEPFGFLCIVNAKRDRPAPLVMNSSNERCAN